MSSEMSDVMTNSPNDDKPSDNKRGREGPTRARITIWIVVGAIALYFIGTGLYGILTK